MLGADLRPALTLLVGLALSSGPALAQDSPPRESTAFTLRTDQPRTVEQEALRIDLADLSIKVLPADRAIDAVAELTFTVTAPVARLVVELDTLFDVSAVSFPANPATIIGLRSDEQSAETPSKRGAFPLSLALAQAAALG
jgi:hypothetical protein